MSNIIKKLIILSLLYIKVSALTPPPPQLPVKSYVLIDGQNGHIIAEKNSDLKLPPASLTKIMSMYVIAESLANKHLHLDDVVTVSPKASKVGGSRMFLKSNEHVSVKDLIRGMMVVSGNDATTALAEHLAGSEEYFAEMMNHYAKQLQMDDSIFVTATGLPDSKHHTTARDLSKVSLKLMQAHAALSPMYHEKFFSHNNVKQTNKNKLIFKDKLISGLKTGHTSEAGYCLVAAKDIDGQSLISVVMGASSEQSRDSATQTLLNYGFRFYETQTLFQSHETINKLRVYGASEKYADLVTPQPVAITVEKGQKPQIAYTITAREIHLPTSPQTPIADLHVTKNQEKIMTVPLYSSKGLTPGGWFRRSWDSVAAFWNKKYG